MGLGKNRQEDSRRPRGGAAAPTASPQGQAAGTRTSLQKPEVREQRSGNGSGSGEAGAQGTPRQQTEPG